MELKEMKYLKNIENVVNMFARTIDFRNESALDRVVSQTTANQMSRFIERITDSLAALKFLVNSKEIVSEIEKLTISFTTFYYKNVVNLKATNRELVSLSKQVEELKALVNLLKNDEAHFVHEVLKAKNEDGYFISTLGITHMGFEKIVIEEKDRTEDEIDRDNLISVMNGEVDDDPNKVEKFNLFFNEIGRAYVLNHHLKNLIQVKDGSFNDINVYGSNEDPDIGKETNNVSNFYTLRGGPRRLSSHFSGVSFENRTYLELFEKDSVSIVKEKPFKDIMSDSNVTVFSGYEVVLMHCYNIKSFSSRNRALKIESAALVSERSGLVSVVYKKRGSMDEEIDNSSMVSRIMHNPNSLPRKHQNRPDGSFVFEIPKKEKPKSFFGKVVSFEDIKKEFEDTEPTLKNVFDMGKKARVDLMSKMSLQEIKPGHIPTLATTGITSGRYVDEILNEVSDCRKGFDHIVCTKIVKRLIEEEEEETTPEGIKITKYTEKMANVIISQALTTQGEFVELFNNDTDEEGA